MSYCEAAAGHPLHGPYHDNEYGFPLRDDGALFERLVLEINQAGLSWLTILKKRENFRAAYDRFDVERVAGYGRGEKARLLRDAGIIRNRLKIDAAVENARRIAALREAHGSFAAWLDAHHPLAKPEWVKLFNEDVPFHGRGDHGGVPDQHGVPAGGACPVVPRAPAHPEAGSAVGARGGAASGEEAPWLTGSTWSSSGAGTTGW